MNILKVREAHNLIDEYDRYKEQLRNRTNELVKYEKWVDELKKERQELNDKLNGIENKLLILGVECTYSLYND